MKLYYIQQVCNESQPHDCIGDIEAYSSKDKRDEELAKKEAEADEYYDYYGFELEVSE